MDNAGLKEYRLLLDFSPIKSGGGAQLALNFLRALADGSTILKPEAILVSDAFPFTDRISKEFEIVVAPSKAADRLWFEYVTLKYVAKRLAITHTYTFFGPGLPKLPGVIQVVGVAYPIICYDESPYWGFLPKTDAFKRRLKNSFRISRLTHADALIFETEIMRTRCITKTGHRASSTFVIPPTPTSFISSSISPPRNPPRNFLFLSGLDPHKNIWRLPMVANVLDERGVEARFLISCRAEDFQLAVARAPKSARVPFSAERFEFLGPVQQQNIQSVYEIADAICNLSDLESFSNNYMEAWLSKRPLIVSDRDFARYICADSAIYVDPHNPQSIADGIEKLISGQMDDRKIAEASEECLNSLPSMQLRSELLERMIFSAKAQA